MQIISKISNKKFGVMIGGPLTDSDGRLLGYTSGFEHREDGTWITLEVDAETLDFLKASKKPEHKLWTEVNNVDPQLKLQKALSDFSEFIRVTPFTLMDIEEVIETLDLWTEEIKAGTKSGGNHAG